MALLSNSDLKSANVFLSNKNMIKIGDLGVAKLLAATRAMAKTQIGTPYYVSPELWKNKPYNAKSDIWALGCLLYEMITGKPPFDSNDMRGLARKVMRGVYPPVSSHYSQDIKDVIQKLLAVNPSHRPSIDDILSMPQVLARMALLPPTEGGAPPGTAASVKSARSDLIGTIAVPRKLRDLTSNLPNPRYDDPAPPPMPPQQEHAADQRDQRLPDLPGAQQQQQQKVPHQPAQPPPGQHYHQPAPPQQPSQAQSHAQHPGSHYAPQRGPGSAASARQPPPYTGSSARSRAHASRQPASSRYSRQSSQGQPNGYRNQADYYGPYHRRGNEPQSGRSSQSGNSAQSGSQYAGSQYARAGYAAGQQGQQGGGAGHGEWERAIEARLARVLGPSYSRRHSQRASGLRG